MNRMKQILEGNDIELLLNEVISNVFHVFTIGYYSIVCK